MENVFFFIKLSLAIDFALSYKQYRLSPQNQKYCRAKNRNNQAPKVIYKLRHRISEVPRISGVAELARCWETRSAKDRQTQLWASWNLWGQIPRYIWLIKAVVSSQYKHLGHCNSLLIFIPTFSLFLQSIFHPGCGCIFPGHNSDDIICKLKTFNDFLYPSIYKLQPIGQIQTTTYSYKESFIGTQTCFFVYIFSMAVSCYNGRDE